MNNDDMPGDGMLRESWELGKVRDGLIAAVRHALRRPKIDGETVEHLGVFLRLVERLPKHDEGQSASMTFRIDTDDGGGIWEAAFHSEGMEISTTEIFRSPWGTDHETKIYFKATYDRCSAEDGLDDWLRHFGQMAEDGGVELSAWSEINGGP
jgi:hypothetical protein